MEAEDPLEEQKQFQFENDEPNEDEAQQDYERAEGQEQFEQIDYINQNRPAFPGAELPLDSP